jgi:four helix bundle protein
MKKFARGFRDLEVYQEAFKAALEVFEVSKSFPAEEKYSLTSQIRDSSRSVCSCIGEAWGKRRYPKHFASKLTDSDSEAGETTVWLDFEFQHGYLSADKHEDLAERYRGVNAQLNRMIDDAHVWAIPGPSRSRKKDRHPSQTGADAEREDP